MNQILSVNMPNNKTKTKKANIKSVIIIFCTITIIFSIVAVIAGIYLINQKSDDELQYNNIISGNLNSNITTDEQPQISVEIDDTQSKLKIIVTHNKKLESVSYWWNNEEPNEVTEIGTNNYEIEIGMLLDTNTLNIKAIDEDGETQTFSEEYTRNGPGLMLQEVDNKIKITAQSDSIISYISYNWDNQEENMIQVNDIRTEQYIDVIEGEHKLNVLAVDRDGNEFSQNIDTLADIKPTLDVQADNDNFYINTQDDEGINKITINLNGQDLDDIIVNGEKQYQTQIPLQQGENRLIITVYNINDVERQERVRAFKQ